MLLITFNKHVTSFPAKTGATTPPALEVLSQSMLLGSPAGLSLQQMTQQASSASSCDYVVCVPTSFVVSNEQVDEFYKSKHKFKQTIATLNLKDATASVFMEQTMFEEFVKFVKKNEHTQELARIAQSYDSALNKLKTTILPFGKLDNRFNSVYMQPTPPVLKYFYTYLPQLYIDANGNNSVGRIPQYVPALNSNMKQTQYVPKVHCIDDGTASPPTHAQPSYNVEIMANFWNGIITGQGLPNRGPLSSSEKLKVIQDNTRVYTFRSTPEYSMNYDALLERLYYKYPCYLKPLSDMSDMMYDEATMQSLLKYDNSKLESMRLADEVLYAICGPVYFDYTWIFKQNPALIKHILGEDTDLPDKTNRWEERTDPLTENKHYVNRNPSNPNHPKTRFDVNPDTSPLPAYCREIYLSPSDARSEIVGAAKNIEEAKKFTDAAGAALIGSWAIDNTAANATATSAAASLPFIYDWTTAGYYRYEITSTVETKKKR